MQSYHLLLLGALMLITLAAVSCRGADQASEAAPGLDLTETAVSAAASSPVPPTVEVVSAETEPEQVDQCLICHTDVQALKDTADPVVVVESENSGEG